MKIKYALHSCNSNPAYLDYWPVVTEAWKRLGIESVLFYVQDDPNVPVPEGRVHPLPLVPNINSVIQAVWGRFWGITRYADDVVIVSDIDLIPLSHWYFVDQFQSIDDTYCIHMCRLNKPAASYTVHTLPILQACYQIGKGALLQKVFQLSEHWEESLRTVVPYFRPLRKTVRNTHNSALKFTRIFGDGDERYITEKARMSPEQSRFSIHIANLCPPPRLSPASHHALENPFYTNVRIENRTGFFYDLDLLRDEYYIDLHLEDLPWRDAQEIIETIYHRKKLPPYYSILIEACLKNYRRHRCLLQFVPALYVAIALWMYIMCKRVKSYYKCPLYKRTGYLIILYLDTVFSHHIFSRGIFKYCISLLHAAIRRTI